MTSILSIANLDKSFGGVHAVQGFGVEIAQREIVGLIGPNGAGKTTVFNLITGIYSPDGGDIVLAGKSVKGLAPREIGLRGIARTFQNIRLFKDLTALENVTVAYEARRGYSIVECLTHLGGYWRNRRAATASALEILDAVGIADYAGVRAGSLPYGHQRKLEIARALALSPMVLLLDEPTSGMNTVETEEMIATVARLRDAFSLAVFLIEHHMGVVMTICRKIVVLNFGQVIAVGSPSEIRSNQAVIEAYLGREDE